MTKAILPAMRKQRSELIINISSLAGLISVPFEGFYTASKFALEGYTEALRHGVKTFNIHVSLVEPGFFKTNFTQARQLTSNTISTYTRIQKRAIDSMIQAEKNGPDPMLVAQYVLRIVMSKSLRLRHRVGKDAIRLPRIRNLVSEAMFELGTRKKFRLDDNKSSLLVSLKT